jgi:hypothetical protein
MGMRLKESVVKPGSTVTLNIGRQCSDAFGTKCHNVEVAMRASGDVKSMAEAKRAVRVFIAIAYSFSIALSLSIGLTGGDRRRWNGLGYVSMLLPAVSASITNAVMREKRRWTGWDRFPIRYLPPALFLMPLAMHAAMLPAAAALDRLHWQEWLTPGADGLYKAPAERGWGVDTNRACGADCYQRNRRDDRGFCSGTF